LFGSSESASLFYYEGVHEPRSLQMQRPSIWEIERRRRESPSRTCCIYARRGRVQLQLRLPIETFDLRDWNEVGLLPGFVDFFYLNAALVLKANYCLFYWNCRC
jgi:hypothetical protein